MPPQHSHSPTFKCVNELGPRGNTMAFLHDPEQVLRAGLPWQPSVGPGRGHGAGRGPMMMHGQASQLLRPPIQRQREKRILGCYHLGQALGPIVSCGHRSGFLISHKKICIKAKYHLLENKLLFIIHWLAGGPRVPVEH